MPALAAGNLGRRRRPVLPALRALPGPAAVGGRAPGIGPAAPMPLPRPRYSGAPRYRFTALGLPGRAVAAADGPATPDPAPAPARPSGCWCRCCGRPRRWRCCRGRRGVALRLLLASRDDALDAGMVMASDALVRRPAGSARGRRAGRAAVAALDAAAARAAAEQAGGAPVPHGAHARARLAGARAEPRRCPGPRWPRSSTRRSAGHRTGGPGRPGCCWAGGCCGSPGCCCRWSCWPGRCARACRPGPTGWSCTRCWTWSPR